MKRSVVAVIGLTVLLILAGCAEEEEASSQADQTASQEQSELVMQDASDEGDADGQAAGQTGTSETASASGETGDAEPAQPEETAASEEPEDNVWRGEPLTFTKADGADPEEPANQDRITENVWITRSNDGGQIFNIKRERRPNKGISPADTQWALGTTDELESLDFKPFRQAVGSPKDVVGKELVMYLPRDDVYLDVVFLSWSQEKLGGFSYRRSTPD